MKCCADRIAFTYAVWILLSTFKFFPQTRFCNCKKKSNQPNFYYNLYFKNSAAFSFPIVGKQWDQQRLATFQMMFSSFSEEHSWKLKECILPLHDTDRAVYSKLAEDVNVKLHINLLTWASASWTLFGNPFTDPESMDRNIYSREKGETIRCITSNKTISQWKFSSYLYMPILRVILIPHLNRLVSFRIQTWRKYPRDAFKPYESIIMPTSDMIELKITPLRCFLPSLFEVH